MTNILNKVGVRNDPDMRRAFEAQFEIKWKDAGSHTQLVYALGYADGVLDTQAIRRLDDKEYLLDSEKTPLEIFFESVNKE